ncbi:MAG: acetate kinase [Peptococcaceae bacterium]|jgi:acetate kinase|nr:acetate kinase [Peptococcaceae bacterium]
MKALVINCGSSSLKYQLFDMADESVLAKGLVERIGLPGSVLIHRPGDSKVEIQEEIPNHDKAISLVLRALTDAGHGVVKNLAEIGCVGHRVVHGGETFSGSVAITPAVMEALKANIELAPLHNPPNIMGIEACAKLMPNTPQAGVFDTAFHQTMPAEAYIYALPYEYYERYKVRRYGFHGTSHRFVSQRAAELLGAPDAKIITCHLGNGASVAAVKGGKSVDTSMGLTPLEGLAMGTRSGDIDPAILEFIMGKEGLTIGEMSGVLNKKSGVLGISGVSSDFRDIETAADGGNQRAKLALDRFAYAVRKYIGAYAAAMDGADAIVFTAGLGENSAPMRAAICAGLTFLGIELEPEKNSRRGEEIEITKAGSKTRVFVIPTNEELVIARDTVAIAEKAEQ